MTDQRCFKCGEMGHWKQNCPNPAVYDTCECGDQKEVGYDTCWDCYYNGPKVPPDHFDMHTDDEEPPPDDFDMHRDEEEEPPPDDFDMYRDEEEEPPPDDFDMHRDEEEEPPPDDFDMHRDEEEEPPPDDFDMHRDEEEEPPPDDFDRHADDEEPPPDYSDMHRDDEEAEAFAYANGYYSEHEEPPDSSDMHTDNEEEKANRCFNCGEIGHWKRQCLNMAVYDQCECGKQKGVGYDKCAICHFAEQKPYYSHLHRDDKEKEAHTTPENISENPSNVIETTGSSVINSGYSESSNVSSSREREESLPKMMQGGSNQDGKEEETFAKAKKLYEAAMKQGSVEISIVKCLVLGIAGVGKTHIKRLLLSEEIKRTTDRVSTGLADNPIQAFVGSVESIIAGAHDDDSGKWEILDEAKLLQVLVRAYQVDKPSTSDSIQIHLPSTQTDSLEMQVSSHLAHFSPPEIQSNAVLNHDNIAIAKNVSETELSTLPPACQHAPHEDSEVHNNPIGIEIDGLFINAFKNLIEKKVLNAKLNLIQFIDSGGQPQFVELLPAFVQDVSAILFVVNLSEELDHCPLIYFYGQDGKPVGKPYVSPSSHKQVLEQSVRAACARDEHSQVFIVGSHRDREGECSETKETKNAIIKRAVNDESLIMKSGTEVLFDINGRNPNDYDQGIAKCLRQAIMHHCGGKKKHSLPIRWFVLEMLIKHTAVHSVLSFNKSLELANKLDMDEKDLEAALLHMVKYNLLLWYEKTMREIVFCDPQVILTIIKDLVQCKHELGQRDASKNIQSDVSGNGPQILCGAAVKGDWCTKFRDHAQINCEFLYSISHFQKRFVDGVFTAEHFIKLMCHLYIGVPLGSSGDFLMPALLDPMSSDQISEFKANRKQSAVEPLLIQFSNTLVPYGMFSCLVAFLQEDPKKCSLSEFDGVPTCLHKNCVSFKYKRISANFTIIDSATYIEVYLDSNNCSKACPMIQNFIHEGIKKCARIINYNGLKDVKNGFICRSCRQSIAVPYEEQPQTAYCLRGCSDMDLTKEHTVWNTEKRKANHRPTLAELQTFSIDGENVHIMTHVADRWKQICVEFNFDPEGRALKRIEQQFPNKPEDCCREIFQIWLKTKGASWNSLITVLESCNEGQLAEQIKTYLGIQQE